MQTSRHRILTTHTGSLPRPEAVLDLLADHSTEDAVRAERLATATAEVVDTQISAGIDVVSDGEVSKESYMTYIVERLDGFGGEADDLHVAYMDDYPEARLLVPNLRDSRAPVMKRLACVGPIALRDPDAVRRDIARLQAATAGKDVTEVFMTAVSPGNAGMYMTNRYYPTEEEYLYTLADAMRPEYRAIVEAGLILQVDAPDLTRRYDRPPGHPLEEVLRDTERNVEVLNHTLSDLPSDRMRVHICWGNSEGPHHRDTELRHIVKAILRARPAGLVLEGANPRHAHEWKVFEELELPEEKVIIPGVVDSVTNFIEHPELVAQRIVQYASVVGRERVIAGTDCGFATSAGYVRVLPRVAWAKLGSLTEGARLASEHLWATANART